MDKSSSIKEKHEFYNDYCIKEVLTIEETIALSFDINPDKIRFNREGIHDEQKKFYQKDFQEEYDRRLEIVREAVLYDNTLHDIEQEYVLFYIQQKNRWPKLWPLKALELCKKKRFPFSVDLEKLIKDYHAPEAEDLEAELKKSKNRIKELEEQLSKKVLEDDLDTKTKKGYDRAIATIAMAMWSDIDTNLNAHNIICKCASRGSNFNYIKDEQTLRKYIGPARELHGFSPVRKNR